MKNKLKVMVLIILIVALVACGRKEENLIKSDRGRVLLQEEKYKEAEDYYKELIKKDEKNSENYYKLSEVYFLLGRVDKEKATLKELIRKSDNNLELAFNKLSEIYYEEEDYTNLEGVLLDLWSMKKTSPLYESIQSMYFNYFTDEKFIGFYDDYNEEYGSGKNIIRRAKLYIKQGEEEKAYKEIGKIKNEEGNLDLAIEEMDFYYENGDDKRILEIIMDNTGEAERDSIYSAYRYWYFSLKDEYFIKDIIPANVNGAGGKENITLYVNDMDTKLADEYMIIVQDGKTDQVYNRHIGKKSQGDLNLFLYEFKDYKLLALYELGEEDKLKELIYLKEGDMKPIPIDLQDIEIRLEDNFKINIKNTEKNLEEIISIPKVDMILYKENKYYLEDGRHLDKKLKNITEDFIISQDEEKIFRYINIHLLANRKIELANILLEYRLDKDMELKLEDINIFQPDYFIK